jgi:hypothetical protein
VLDYDVGCLDVRKVADARDNPKLRSQRVLFDELAKSGAAKQALVALEGAGIGEGALLPYEILVEGNTDPNASRGEPASSGWRPRRGRARWGLAGAGTVLRLWT